MFILWRQSVHGACQGSALHVRQRPHEPKQREMRKIQYLYEVEPCLWRRRIVEERRRETKSGGEDGLARGFQHTGSATTMAVRMGQVFLSRCHQLAKGTVPVEYAAEPLRITRLQTAEEWLPRAVERREGRAVCVQQPDCFLAQGAHDWTLAPTLVPVNVRGCTLLYIASPAHPRGAPSGTPSAHPA